MKDPYIGSYDSKSQNLTKKSTQLVEKIKDSRVIDTFIVYIETATAFIYLSSQQYRLDAKIVTRCQ